MLAQCGGGPDSRAQASGVADKRTAAKEVRARFAPRFRLAPARRKACALVRSNFLKSYEYVNRVKRFKDKDAVTQVRQCVLSLQSYPMPALRNLVTDTSQGSREEASGGIRGGTTWESAARLSRGGEGTRVYFVASKYRRMTWLSPLTGIVV